MREVLHNTNKRGQEREMGYGRMTMMMGKESEMKDRWIEVFFVKEHLTNSPSFPNENLLRFPFHEKGRMFKL